MIIFGTKIDLDYNLLQANNLRNRLVAQMLKRSDERKIFAEFLGGNNLSGRGVYEDLVQSPLVSSPGVEAGLVKDFVVSELKQTPSGHTSVYESIVRSLVEELDPSLKIDHLMMDKNSGQYTQLSSKYPVIRNKAENMLKAKLAEPDLRLVELYLKRKHLESNLRELTQFMFFGVSKLGLEGEDLIKFLHVLNDLKNISQIGMERPARFMSILGEAIESGSTLNLINLKCLRRVYPSGKNLKLLTHLDSETILNKDGEEFQMPSEADFFDNLEIVNRVFTRQDIKTKMKVLLMDTDMDDHFSGCGVGFVPDEDVAQARTDILEYMENMQKVAGDKFRVTTFTQYLNEQALLGRFHGIKEQVLMDLRRGGNRFLSEKIVEDRVNYRFTANEVIFGVQNRDQARFSAYNQIASLIGLQVLCAQDAILVSENREIENKIIGGRDNKDLPMIFVKLIGKSEGKECVI